MKLGPINYLLGFVILAYAVFISYAVFSAIGNQRNPQGLVVQSEVILNPVVTPGEPLQVRIEFALDKAASCSLNAHRIVFDAHDGQLMWEEFTTPKPSSTIVSPRYGIVKLPVLKVGNYYYKVTVSLVCGVGTTSQSYTYESDALPFTVVEKHT